MKRLLALLLFLPVLAFAGQITWNWVLPTTCTDGSPIAQCALTKVTLYTAVKGQPKTVLVTLPPTAITFTALNTPAGTFCGEVTVSSATAESVHTGEVCATVAAPAPSPPTGVTAVAQVLAADNSAYKLRQSVDGYTMVAFGTVPVGTICDATHSVDGYSLIPRSFVKLASAVDTLPLLSFAKCS